MLYGNWRWNTVVCYCRTSSRYAGSRLLLIGATAVLIYALAAAPALSQEFLLADDSSLVAETPSSLAIKLKSFDGSIDEYAIAAVLTELRRRGNNASVASPTLTRLLDERSDLFANRGPYEVRRLRAFILVTLAEIGPGNDALSVVAGELAHGQDPLPMAAAARVAGSLGPAAQPIVVHLLDTLDAGFHDAEVDLGSYNLQGALQEPTTVRQEAIRALASINSTDQSVRNVLNQIIGAPADGFYGRMPQLKVEASRTLAKLDETVSSASIAEDPTPAEDHMATPWLAPSDRPATTLASMIFSDHDASTFTFGDLTSQPLALIFFFTSCHNANKCSFAVSHLALLQDSLKETGLADSVRLAAVTYDPEFDTSLRLRRFGENRGLELGSQAMMLRASPSTLEQLIEALAVQVNFGAGQINAHRLQLFLLDRRGRFVRQYHSVAWDNSSVVADLRRLNSER